MSAFGFDPESYRLEVDNVTHMTASLLNGDWYDGLDRDAVRAVDFLRANLVMAGEMPESDDTYDLGEFFDTYTDPPAFVTTPHTHRQ